MAEEHENDEELGSYDTSDPEQVAKRRRTAGRKKKSKEGAVSSLMASKEGRAFVMGLLDACHIFGTTFTGDALSGAFKEGERNIGLQLLSVVTRAAPEEYALMLKERDDV